MDLSSRARGIIAVRQDESVLNNKNEDDDHTHDVLRKPKTKIIKGILGRHPESKQSQGNFLLIWRYPLSVEQELVIKTRLVTWICQTLL